jgi:hypothetical protein
MIEQERTATHVIVEQLRLFCVARKAIDEETTVATVPAVDFA